MEKNYYEILEVDKNASKEIIDKAYKTLAKKYHPDLQSNNVKEFEEKMKKINEAYSILTNEEQREAYDQQLKDCFVPIDEYQRLLQENIILKEKLNEIYMPIEDINNINVQLDAEEDIPQNSNQNNIGFSQKYREYYTRNTKKNYMSKKSIKEYCKSIIALLLTILIFIIILQIPFVKRFFVQIYDDNIVIQTIVQIFKNIFEK